MNCSSTMHGNVTIDGLCNSKNSHLNSKIGPCGVLMDSDSILGYVFQVVDVILIAVLFHYACGYRQFNVTSSYSDMKILFDWQNGVPDYFHPSYLKYQNNELCSRRIVSIARASKVRRRYRSEPRPSVTVTLQETDVSLERFDFETWELENCSEVAGSKTTSETNPCSPSTDSSFPETTPLKNRPPGLASPYTSDIPYPNWCFNSPETSLYKSKTELHSFRKRPLDLNNDQTTYRPKSKPDENLEPIPLPSDSLSLLLVTPPCGSSSSSAEPEPCLRVDQPKLAIFSPRRSLYDLDDTPKTDSRARPISFPASSSLSHPIQENLTLTPTLRTNCITCNHDDDLQPEDDRTFFWRKTILNASKIAITADYNLPQEATSDYCYGGYEQVQIGHVYHERYLVIRKIGWGHFSTVWLCGDLLLKRLVAVKIVKSGKVFAETAQDEITLLRDVSIVGNDNEKLDYFVRIYDQFEFRGENGKHKGIVFELLGCNLYKLTTLTLGVGVDTNYVKVITKQVLEGLVFLHEDCGIIHTDIKPENILISGSAEFHRKVALNVAKWLRMEVPWPKQYVSNWNDDKDCIVSKKVKDEIMDFITSIHIQHCNCIKDQKNYLDYVKRLNNILNDGAAPEASMSPEINVFHVPTPKNLRIKIADLGNACYDHTHFCEQIQTCQYRGPETILGGTYSYSADIWSLACVVFELAAGDYLFDPRPSPKGEYSCDDDHLAHMIELLGPMPDRVWKSGKWSDKFFSNDGKLRRITELNTWPIAQVLQEKYDFSEEESAEFASFLKPMLDFDPKTRVSARECLKHPWLKTA